MPVGSIDLPPSKEAGRWLSKPTKYTPWWYTLPRFGLSCTSRRRCCEAAT